MDYNDKINDMLDPNTYKKPKRGSRERLLGRTNKLIITATSINEQTKPRLRTTEYVAPQLIDF